MMPSQANPRALPLHALGAAGIYIATVGAVLGAAVGAVPVGPIHLFPYRILLPALLALFAVSGLYTPAPVWPRHMHRLRYPMLFLGLWLAWAVAGVFQARDLGAWASHTLFLFMGVVLIFLTVLYLDRLDRLARLGRLWLVMVVAAIVFGAMQHATGYQLPISEFAGADDASRFKPTGPFPRLNQYAVFLVLGAPWLLVPVATAPRRPAALAGGGWLASAYLVAVTGSRLSLLALGVQLVVAVAFFFPPQRRRLFGLVLLIGAAGGYGLQPQTVNTLLLETGARFQGLIQQIMEGHGSGGVRINLFLNGLLFARDSAGLGMGAGSFEAAIDAGAGYYSTVYHTWADSQVIDQPHNFAIELLSEYGLLVLLGFSAFAVDLFRRVLVRYQAATDPADRWIGQALILGLIGYAFASLALGYFTNYRPGWLILALGTAYASAPRPPLSTAR